MALNFLQTKIAGTTLAALGIVSVVLSAAAFALPSLFHSQDGSTAVLAIPPVGLLVGFGLAVIIGVTIILKVAIRSGLELSQATFYSILGFNAAIILVKFVLAPLGLYSFNANNPFLEDGGGILSFGASINNTADGFISAAISTGIAYSIVLIVLYILVRGRKPNSSRSALSPNSKRAIAVALIAIAAIGWQYIYIYSYILLAGPLIDYLTKIGEMAAFVAAILVVAIVLAFTAFRTTHDWFSPTNRAVALSAVLWTCLSLILMYHVLWVIFMTALVTIWPFKTFLPSGGK